jgi:hypothetical protein
MIMTAELPSRPKPDPDDEQTIIDPQDRVKSAHDKPDPRFEAARQKAEREAKVYAERAEREPDEDEPTVDADDDAEADAPEDKGTFSFNMTAGEVEEDR